MRPQTSLSVLTLPFFLVSLIEAAGSFDCSHVRVQKHSYNFEKLGGLHSVTVQESSSPSITNTTWSLDLCANLKKEKNVASDHQCPGFTRVCGITKVFNPERDPDFKDPDVQRVLPVAGHSDGETALDPSEKKLDSDGEEGVVIEFNGGKDKDKNRKQKAVIHMICDKSVSGNEGSKVSSRALKSTKDKTRDDDDDEDSGKPKQDPNSSLQFISYGVDTENESIDTLRLDWRTKYACKDYEAGDDDDDEEGGSKKAGWGFFTWFILILFLGIAAYLIFGSWLNYNRYGARGWDLLPHGDTIRDLPYLFKDWSRSVVDTVTGGHSREGAISV